MKKKFVAAICFSLALTSSVYAAPFYMEGADIEAQLLKELEDEMTVEIEEVEEVEAEESLSPSIIAKQNEIRQIREELGINEFWNSITPEELSEYYINEDLTVDFMNDNIENYEEQAKTTKTRARRSVQDYNQDYENKIKSKDKFEEKLNNLVNNINEYNRQQGYEETTPVDGNGGLAIGAMGDASGSNSLSLSGRKKGDIVFLDGMEFDFQGAIMHAGMYDGTNADICIYSASPNGSTTGVRWECVSEWQNYDWAAVASVKGTTTSEKKTAYFTMKADANFQEDYSYFASKSSKDEWYCSKIPWYGYYYGLDIDIDSDGGYYVLPDDIFCSSYMTNVVEFD